MQTPTELEFLITSFPWRGPENKQYREKMIIRVKCESRDQRDKWKHEIESRIPFLNNQSMFYICFDFPLYCTLTLYPLLPSCSSQVEEKYWF